jgi:uncharacterized protein (DUF1499 family)
MKVFFAVLIFAIIILLAGYWLGARLAAESRVMAVNSSLENNQLAACPPTPNCVNSDSTPADEAHFIIPIADADGTRWAKLLTTINSMEGAKLVTFTDDYAYFTFTTKLLGFVDDVEFHNRPDDKLIAVRSASRVGKSDLGLNRRRVEEIRVALGL